MQEGNTPLDIATKSQNKGMIALLSGEGEAGEEKGEEMRNIEQEKTGRLERLGSSITNFFSRKGANLVRKQMLGKHEASYLLIIDQCCQIWKCC